MGESSQRDRASPPSAHVDAVTHADSPPPNSRGHELCNDIATSFPLSRSTQRVRAGRRACHLGCDDLRKKLPRLRSVWQSSAGDRAVRATRAAARQRVPVSACRRLRARTGRPSARGGGHPGRAERDEI